MRLFELVGIFEFEAMQGHGEDQDYRFRVEILRDVDAPRTFSARIYRLESLRVRPTFPLNKNKLGAIKLADHEFFVVDNMIGNEEFHASSKSQVLAKVRKRICDVFGSVENSQN